MAIDEHDMFAGVADDSGTDGSTTTAAVRAPEAGADTEELRRRLETPLFAREPGSMPSAQVPGLRELTWDHVTNPTTSVPVVPGESIFGEQNGAPRPSPLKLDDVLPRREVGLKPIEPTTLGAPGQPAVVPAAEPGTQATAPLTAPPGSPLDGTPSAGMPLTSPPVTPASTPATEAAAPPMAPLQPLSTGTQSATRPALPSFADIVSTPAGAAAPLADAYTRPDAVDSLLKPIDEPPPVARETDPLVDGLAELIVRSTPSVGMPRVAELREVSRGDTGVVPSTGGRPLDPPVLDAAVEFANVSTSVPVIEGPEPEIITGSHSAVPSAEVEAEMNRLAFLPDQDDEPDGPVEVPAIASAEIRGIDAAPAAAAPSLSTGEVYTPKPSSSPVRHNYADILASTVVPVVRKRKRHVVRKIVGLFLLLALIGGGMFAVKHFVLDRVKWTGDLEPLAKQVEAARGLTFDDSVEVTVLPADAYAVRLVATAGYGTENATIDDAQLRTLGLAKGEVDRAAIGRLALWDAPAFYDPADRVIYQLDGLPTELREFALHRALTMALLDQRFGWVDRVAGEPAVNVRGTIALYDADALAVANQIVGDDTALRTTLATQSFTLLTDNNATPTPSPFVTAIAGRAGLAGWAYMATLVPEDRDLLETDALLTDAKVLDLRRLLDGSAEPSSDPDSKGMLFWYHVLASRAQPNLAWQTALAWRTDATTTTEQADGVCTSAKVVFDAKAGKSVEAAFSAWSAAAPPESKTQVRISKPANGAVTVAVTGCDPGAKAATITQPVQLSMGGAPLRIAQVASIISADPSVSAKSAACAAYVSDAVSLQDDRNLIDASLPWPQIAAHATVDPAIARCKG